jgi:radical SAM protein with 4Fe4S-binding SPASM domain
MMPLSSPILKYLTFRRISNAAKVWFSFYLAKWTRRPIQWGVPISISIEPTTACNLRCPECPSGLRSFTRETGNLKQDFFRQIIGELHDKIMFLTFYFQGEPYINPAFLDMVKYAHDKGIYTMTSSNAHFLNDENARKTIESGLDELIISVDGTTQEVYEQYRKEGSLAKVLEGAANIIKWKKQLNSKSPKVVFQFLVVKPNEHQIPEVYELAKQIGVDEVRLKTAQIYDFKNGNPLIPENTKYARYIKQSDGTYRIKHELINQCWRLWHTAVITWDGWVVPCCFDKDAKYKMGLLKENSFQEIWQGEMYQFFRSQLLKSRSEIDICANCSEGCKVVVD